MNTAVGLILSRGWMSVCGVVTFILVARNLTQAEFGVFALVSSASILPQMLVGAGFYEYVIGRDPKGELERDAEAWSILSGALGGLLVLILACLTWVIFKAPAAAWLLSGFSLVSLLWGFSAIREATLIRDGRGGAVAQVLVGGETVGMIALVIAFASGAGVFALLVGRLANALTVFCGFWLRTRTAFPLFRIDLKRGREMLRYTRGAAGARVIRWANGWGIDFAVGLVMSLANVGLFRMGMRLFQTGSAILIDAPNAAMLKYLGRAHAAGRPQLRRITLRVFRLHSLFVSPSLVAAGAFAGFVVDTVLGPDWSVSGDVVTIFCLAGPLLVGMGVNATVMMASGRTNTLVVYQVFTTVLSLSALMVGGLGGPIWAASGRVIMWAVIVATAGVVIKTEIGRDGCTAFFSAVARHVGAVAAMGGWTMAWLYAMPDEGPLLGELAERAAAAGSGFIVFFAVIYALDRPTIDLVRSTWRLSRRPLLRFFARTAPA